MKKQSKTAFILTHSSLSAAEVVREAAKHGVKLTIGYVYNIRSRAKGTRGGPRRGPGRPPKAAVGVATSGSVEKKFLNLALDLGIRRAETLLRGVRTLARA